MLQPRAEGCDEEGPVTHVLAVPGGSIICPVAGWAPGGLLRSHLRALQDISQPVASVMQLHYNVLNGGVTPDQTSVEFTRRLSLQRWN